MGDLLDRLESLVRTAEEKSLQERVERDLREATEALRDAVRENEAARKEREEARERRNEIIETIDIEEQRLVDLLQRIASLGEKIDRTEAEALAAESRREIDEKRRQAEQLLEAAEEKAAAAVRALQEATAAYREAREGAEKAGVEETDDDHDLADAMSSLPEGELLELEREVEDAEPWFGQFPRESQYTRVKIWIGRLRRLQQMSGNEDQERRMRRLFTRLVGISKEHQPGYIEAFRQEFRTNWDTFIRDSEEELQALEAREAHQREKERSALERERELAARRRRIEESKRQLRSLTAWISPSEGRGVKEMVEIAASMPVEAWSDDEILGMLLPFTDRFEGADLRGLRRNLQKFAERRESPEPESYLPPEEVLKITEGKRAVLVGGEPREPARQSLASTFRFALLEWIPSSDSEAARLESRIARHSVDLVIVIRSLVSHAVSNRLFAACKESDVPFALVDQGYGASRIAQALRPVTV